MGKKQWITGVVEELAANPRKVLAGHGISGAMLKKISEREDVMKYLASNLYYLRSRKLDARGLKKSNVLNIKAYKNFAEFNTKARLDVEKFMSGLKGKDLAEFSNADNIVAIVFAPTQSHSEEGDDIIIDMLNPSEQINFDKAVRKEYKIPGASYVIMMIAPSAVLPAEERKASMLANKTKRKNDVEDKAAKIKARFAKKKKLVKKQTKRALGKLDAQRAALQDRQFGLNMQNAQYQYLRKKTGAQDLWTGIQNMNAKAAALAAKRLNSTDAKLFMLANKLKEQGDDASAKAILSKIKDRKKVAAIVNGGGLTTTGNDMIDARKKELARTIRQVSKKLEQLEVDLALAPVQKRTSVKSMISKYKAQLKQLKARMKFYNDKNTMAMGGKAQQLAQVRAAIEANIEQGKSISASLNTALATLDAEEAQKLKIKQDIVQQVADGVPMQFAVQQAIQDNIEDVVNLEDELLDDNIESTGTISFSDLMNML